MSSKSIRRRNAKNTAPAFRFPAGTLNEELLDFLENAAVGMHWIAPGGAILWANTTEMEMLGYEPPEYIGRNISEFHADRHVVQDLLERLARRETIHDYEARMICKDGSIRHVQIDSNAYFRDGEFIHSKCITRDISSRKMAEAARRESEERLVLALEAGNMGSWEWDVRAGTVSWSESLERLHGLQPGTFDGTLDGFKRDIHPDDRETVFATISEALETRMDYRVEYRICPPDGTTRWVEARGKLFLDERNQPAKMRGVCMDITRRKSLEERHHRLMSEFQRQAQTLNGILFSSADHIYVFDRDHRYIYVSNGGATFLGLEPHDLIGKTWREIGLPAEIMETVDGELEQVFAAGRSIMSETPFGSGDDTSFFEYMMNPIFNEERLVQSVVVISRDVTQRRRAEEALRISEQRFRLLVEQSPLGIRILDANGSPLLVNRAWKDMLGMESEEETRNGGIAIELEPYLQTALSGTPVVSPPLRSVPKHGIHEGTERWTRAFIYPIKYDGGRLKEIILAQEDITESRRAERRLQTNLDVTRILAVSPALPDAVKSILETICRTLGWRVGLLWEYDTASDALKCTSVWTDPDTPSPSFEEDSRKRTFSRGVGLPGRVWDSIEPAWIADAVVDNNFPRSPFARKDGLHGAFGFPILLDKRFIGVMEFISNEIRPPDPELLDMMRGIGAQIGQYIGRKHAEEELQYQFDLTKTLADNSPSVLLMVDEYGMVTFANPALEHVLGYSTQTMLGMNLHERLHDAGICKGYQCPIVGATAAEALTGVDDAILKNDGTIMHVRFSSRPIVKNGRRVGTVIEVQDTSDRKHFENEMRLSNDRFSFLARASAVVTSSLEYESRLKQLAEICVPFLADWCAIDIMNEHHILERVAVEHPDPGAAELVHQMARKFGPRESKEMGAVHVIETGIPELFEDISDEVLCKYAVNEEHLEMLRSLRMRSAMLIPLIARGKSLGLIALVSNSDSRRYTLDDLSIALELAGRAALAIDNARLFEEIQAAFQNLKVKSLEIEQLNSELELRVARRTEELGAAYKELEAFSYSVSHDLRAPLRHIDGFIELLHQRASSSLDEKSKQHLGVISSAAQQMGRLIDDLLEFSRAGRANVERSSVDLNELVNRVRVTLDPPDSGRQIEWKIADLPQIWADASMIELVWNNLLSNALKFTRTRPNPTIEIGSLHGEHGETILYVKDNGVGFNMDYADKLFGVFQRLHRSDEFEGTGIGLANVRRIIERHGGTVWARGNVGEGAVFYFSLTNPMSIIQLSAESNSRSGK